MPNRQQRRAATKIEANVPRNRSFPLTDTNLVFPLDVKPVFSDGLMVSFAGESVILSFLKTVPTLLKPTTKADEIETRCVAQIAITPSQMAENLKVLNAQFLAFVNEQPDESLKEYLLEKAKLKPSK